MNRVKASRFSRATVRLALAMVIVALAPGLAPYEAAAQFTVGSAAGSASHGPAPIVLPASSSSGGVLAPPAVLVPALGGISLVSAAAFIPGAVIPVLPVSAVPTAVFVETGHDRVAEHSSVEKIGVLLPAGVRAQLFETVSNVFKARDEGVKTGLFNKLFTGMRLSFGLDERPPAVVVRSAPALAAAVVPVPLILDQVPPTSGEKAAVPAAPQIPPAGDDWIDKKGIAGMFIQRSISIAAFILTSLAYPLVAIHAVGASSFGALMALGPLAAIATGPLNGFIADKMSPRNGLILLTVLRGLLAFALPAFTYLGVMGFTPLLLASIANGWQLSLLITSENAYFRRMAGKKHIETINSLGAVNFFSLQVLLTLIVGVGSFIDRWDSMTPFVLSTLVHIMVVAPIIWFMIPNTMPAARATVAAAARSFRGVVRDRAAKASAFFKKYWKEFGLFGLGVGAYLTISSPLPMSAALFWWVSRTDGFKEVWSQKTLRATMILSALAFGLIYPFQYMAVPLMAGVIGGAAGKGLVLGQLLGAFFFGQLTANASQAKLPSVRIPFTSKTIPAQCIIQGAVLALAAAWSFLRLFPASWPAVAAAVVLGALLMYGSSKFTSRGWIKSLGIGLAATSVLPLVFWGFMPAVFAGMLLFGLFAGPTAVVLNSYFSRNAKEASIGNAFGVNGSLINSSTSFGYGLMTVLISFFHPAFPGALGPIAVAFLVIGAVFFFAPRFLPGLNAR